MHTNTMIQPGQRGAKKFADQYGDRLVCVRYRQDEVRQKRLTTIIQTFGDAAYHLERFAEGEAVEDLTCGSSEGIAE